MYLFLERGEEKENEGERNINMWLPLAHPLLGTWPATQACALTGNLSSDPLVHRPVLNLLSYTCQGYLFIYFFSFKFPLLILEREEGREKERERNIDVREKHQLVAPCTHPDWGPNPQPRHVPRLGIKPTTFWFAGQPPTN